MVFYSASTEPRRVEAARAFLVSRANSRLYIDKRNRPSLIFRCTFEATGRDHGPSLVDDLFSVSCFVFQLASSPAIAFDVATGDIVFIAGVYLCLEIVVGSCHLLSVTVSFQGASVRSSYAILSFLAVFIFTVLTIAEDLAKPALSHGRARLGLSIDIIIIQFNVHTPVHR
jgi:hypothetical protein